jgi:hypothetical protein
MADELTNCRRRVRRMSNDMTSWIKKHWDGSSNGEFSRASLLESLPFHT